jgi:hypothetical protein
VAGRRTNALPLAIVAGAILAPPAAGRGDRGEAAYVWWEAEHARATNFPGRDVLYHLVVGADADAAAPPDVLDETGGDGER